MHKAYATQSRWFDWFDGLTYLDYLGSGLGSMLQEGDRGVRGLIR